MRLNCSRMHCQLNFGGMTTSWLCMYIQWLIKISQWLFVPWRHPYIHTTLFKRSVRDWPLAQIGSWFGCVLETRIFSQMLCCGHNKTHTSSSDTVLNIHLSDWKVLSFLWKQENFLRTCTCHSCNIGTGLHPPSGGVGVGCYCHKWAIKVCAAVKGMIFKQFTLA